MWWLLSSGVNISHWHWLPPGGVGPEQRSGLISRKELDALAAAGLKFVRLPVEPEDYWDWERSEFRDGGEAALLTAVEEVLAAKLAVIFDCHPRDAAWSTPSPEGRFERLEAFWADMSVVAAKTDPERVFLEIMNEPHDIKDAQVWPRGQARIAEIIRSACPKHTLIATGDEWGSIDGLDRLTPLTDRNVVYSFHFYDPHCFTHQGASWGFPPWKHMKGVPWPMTRESIAPVLAAIEDPQARAALEWETREPWDLARLRRRMNQAAVWGERHEVPILCGEYGVFAEFASREARLAWLRDVTAAFRTYGITSAMWDYCGGFRLATGAPGERVLDAEVAEAIGLRLK
jgi:endoglucanase